MTNLLELDKRNEKLVVLGLLGIYLICCTIWQFMTDAPWDDDCVGRYYNAKEALNDPKHFIALWNRPIFILLFFIPFQISKHAILLMALLTAGGVYALYKALKELETPNAFLIVPLLVFQAFFFQISKSALAEPIAAAIICFGFLFLVRKQFLAFALIGSLLPLARLELAPFLGIWAIILILNKKWKYILLFGIPLLLWSLAGTIIDGDLFWLYEQTLGKENDSNRYGHTGFWHYFQRYIFVIGPVVFYFFFIGFLENLYKRKFNLFVIGQFALGFIIYVIFSWKLNLGQAAGFLRHLITLSPLAAILALQGYNYWMESLQTSKPIVEEKKKDKSDADVQLLLENRIQEIEKQGKEQNLKAREIRHLINKEKRELENKKTAVKEKKQQHNKDDKKTRNARLRIVLYSAAMIGLIGMYSSKKLLGHHKLSDVADYTNIIILGVITLLFLTLAVIARNKPLPTFVKLGLAVILSGSIMSYTLITEPPNAHNSPERQTMGEVSNIYAKSYLTNHNKYVNHSWFFWSSGLVRDEKTDLITQENLEAAPDSSIIIWENHYSHRLAGDVQIQFFANKPEYVEIFREQSSDQKFVSMVYQKIKLAQPTDVFKVYDRFIAYAPDIPSVYVNKGMKYNQYKNYEEAIKNYDLAIQVDSNYIDAYFNKGLSNFNQRKYADAKVNFNKAAQLRPKYYQAHYNYGVSLTNLGDFKNAITAYSEVIKLKADYTQAYLNRAIAYTNVKDYEKAIADYSSVIKLNPKNGQAYHNRGALQFQMNKKDNACKDLKKAVELGNAPSQNILNQYCK